MTDVCLMYHEEAYRQENVPWLPRAFGVTWKLGDEEFYTISKLWDAILL